LRATNLSFEITNASQTGGTTTADCTACPRILNARSTSSFSSSASTTRFAACRSRKFEQSASDHRPSKSAQSECEDHHRRNALPNYASDDYVFAFGQIYADLAAKNSAALIPYLLEGVSGDPLLNQPDRVHPNAAGQKILADNVWRVLEPIARETAAEPAARVQ